MTDFVDRLFGMLPEVYALEDKDGDLRAFFTVVGLTLDELKERIDHIPDLASPADSPAEFLGYLAALVGAEHDPRADPGPQRERLREAIERYRRIGTVSGLDRELRRLGWSGAIMETFRQVLRLNYRSRLNYQKLPGIRYNHGIYGIAVPLEDNTTFDEIIVRHQPAGTIMWVGEENSA